MAGRDHDAGRSPQVAHGKGRDRRRQGSFEPPGPHSARRRHPHRVLGELSRTVPGVVPDDDARHRAVVVASQVKQVLGQSDGRLPDHQPVHSTGTGSHLAAQPGGAES